MKALWVEQYRPSKISDVILPKTLTTAMNGIVKTGDIPNMIFYGGPGVGKTTVAKALIEELDGSCMMINGSDDSGIDALRTKVRNFASTASLTGGQKVVIYDEADALTAATQAALRGFLEEFADSCRFIFTCNHYNKLIEPLRDRCVSYDFSAAVSDKEMEKMQARMFQRLTVILDGEGVEYDPAVLVAMTKHYAPRWRKLIGDLNQYSKSGKIDTGVLAILSKDEFAELVGYMREKNFKAVQNWVVEHGDQDAATLIEKFYDRMRDVVKPQSIVPLIYILNNWQYRASIVANPEINSVDHLAQIMSGVEFKE